MTKNYRLTTVACFSGIFAQAVISNVTAILFVPFMGLYGFSFIHLGMLVAINFSAQFSADIIFSGLIDRIGFRRISLITCVAAFAGLLLFALTPFLFSNIFTGFVISTVLFSFASGLLEITLSPIIDAIPYENKGPVMSLMHSFYAWGQVATIIITTLFLFLAGSGRWQAIIFVWSLLPLATFFMFLRANMPPNSEAHTNAKAWDMLKNKFFIFAMLAIMFGAATEVCMNQWASSFTESALGLPKVTGDLLGMCGFAVMLGSGRLLYAMFGHKIKMIKVLVTGSAVCIFCYALAALSPFNMLNVAACAVTGLFSAMLWPGVLVISSEKFPASGAWMFAMLAAAGDIGAGAGPYLTGVIADYTSGWSLTKLIMDVYNVSATSASMRVGILIAAAFPLATLGCHFAISRMRSGQSLQAFHR